MTASAKQGGHNKAENSILKPDYPPQYLWRTSTINNISKAMAVVWLPNMATSPHLNQARSWLHEKFFQ